MNKILVAYATKRGTTKEIATRIAETIKQNGYEVDLCQIDQVKEIRMYSAVVVGSSVYIGQWHKTFVKFLEANNGELKKMPVWLYSSGPTGNGKPLELTKGWLYPSKFKSLVEEIAPVDIALFQGKISSNTMNFLEKWIIKRVGAPIGDYRQWELISQWADKIQIDQVEL